MLEILERIVAGKGTREDLDLLDELASTITDTALCGLGKITALSGYEYSPTVPPKNMRNML